MGIIYREEKGSPLTVEELDGNFRELEKRLSLLEDHQERSEGIGKISLHNETLTITGTFGMDFGSFPLPKPTFPLRGQWQPQSSYRLHDIVAFESGLFQCLRDHESTTWSQSQDKWKPLLPLKTFSLPLFERATLPKEEELGTLALLLSEESPTLIFFNGKSWQTLEKGETL